MGLAESRQALAGPAEAAEADHNSQRPLRPGPGGSWGRCSPRPALRGVRAGRCRRRGLVSSCQPWTEGRDKGKRAVLDAPLKPEF